MQWLNHIPVECGEGSISKELLVGISSHNLNISLLILYIDRPMFLLLPVTPWYIYIHGFRLSDIKKFEY